MADIERRWLVANEDGSDYFPVSNEAEANVYVEVGRSVSGPWVSEAQLTGAVHRYEELRGWVTEALNTPGAPYGDAREALLNGLSGVTRPREQ